MNSGAVKNVIIHFEEYLCLAIAVRAYLNWRRAGLGFLASSFIVDDLNCFMRSVSLSRVHTYSGTKQPCTLLN